jgi:hypothetical protein
MMALVASSFCFYPADQARWLAGRNIQVVTVRQSAIFDNNIILVTIDVAQDRHEQEYYYSHH